MMTLQARRVTECSVNDSGDTDTSDGFEMDDYSHVVLNVGCSETFRRALQSDVYDATSTTSNDNSSTCDKHAVKDNDENESVEEEQEEEEQQQQEEETSARPTAGRRAWNRLRVYVDEQAVQRRHSGTTMNWTLIRRTLDAMSQRNQSRALLYQRYLQRPDNWLHGFINCPTRLQSQQRTERTAAAAAAASDAVKTTTEH